MNLRTEGYGAVLKRAQELQPNHGIRIRRQTKTPIETIRASLWRTLIRANCQDEFRSYILDSESMMLVRIDTSSNGGETFRGV